VVAEKEIIVIIDVLPQSLLLIFLAYCVFVFCFVFFFVFFSSFCVVCPILIVPIMISLIESC
jgi:hypothetical protein